MGTMNPPEAQPPAPEVSASGQDVFVHELGGWRRLVLWPFAFVLRCWGRSLRFELSPESLRNLTQHDGGPVAFVLWHNRLFLTTEIFRRYRQRPVCALVSTSRDGAWITAFFSLVGMRAVRGSSSKGGHDAARGLVAALRAGHDVGVTPDGPRGPRYSFKPGAVVVTRRAEAAILLIGGKFQSAWRLRSWDKFIIPHPFSRVRIECERVSPAELRQREITEQLEERLRSINPDTVGTGPAAV